MRNRNRHNRPTRCIDGRTMRHDPQPDDPGLETDIGKCPECNGKDCDQEDVSSEDFLSSTGGSSITYNRNEIAKCLFNTAMASHGQWDDMSEPNKKDWLLKADAWINDATILTK